MGTLYCGDCLDIMEKKLEPESVDLIYADPPFFSNKHYEVIWGDEGEIRSFEDRWEGGKGAYEEAAAVKRRDGLEIVCLTVEEILRKPPG